MSDVHDESMDVPRHSVLQLGSGVTEARVPDSAHVCQGAHIQDQNSNPLCLVSALSRTESDRRRAHQLRCANQLTSAGQVLPHLHDRLRRQYRRDCALRQMFDSQQSGCDDMFWFPGIIICNHWLIHCRAHLEDPQRRSQATLY